MSMPGMYVSPEQLMSDRADFARKGIARGRSLVVLEYDHGIALVAENTSATLRKVSEIYDRIAFGGVGRYSEFDTLRIAGLRLAELTGYQYSRDDVEARSLANQYAQMLGHTFTHEMKPMEVEIVVAELAPNSEDENALYRIQYDGTVTDQHRFCCIGGESEAVFERVEQGYSRDLDRQAAIALAVESLSDPNGQLTAAGLEIAVLEATGQDTVFARRCFRRLTDEEAAQAAGVPLAAMPNGGSTGGGGTDGGGTDGGGTDGSAADTDSTGGSNTDGNTGGTDSTDTAGTDTDSPDTGSTGGSSTDTAADAPTKKTPPDNSTGKPSGNPGDTSSA